MSVTNKQFREYERKMKVLHNRVDRAYKRIKWLQNKYYSWQHYFTVKQRRFDRKLKYKNIVFGDIHTLRRRLKNLSLRRIKGRSQGEEKHILLLTNNDATRLQRFLQKDGRSGR